MPAPRLTVVVPTRERSGSLARCVAALEAQTVADSLEIVVVDDGAESSQPVAKVVTASPSARLVRTGGCGAAAARNAGAAAARGALVLFTDDDCVPAPDWAAQLADALDRGVAAAAGGSRVAASDGDLAAASQHVADFLTQATAGVGGQTRFAASSNLGCRTEVIRQVRFDEAYPAAGGEDRDWCARLIESGHELVLMPEAVVLHRPELSLGRFWRQHLAYGRGARIFRRRHGAADTGASRGFHLRLVRAAFGQGVAVGALVSVAQLATAVGFARETILGARQ